jgi:hypothetical protein
MRSIKTVMNTRGAAGRLRLAVGTALGLTLLFGCEGSRPTAEQVAPPASVQEQLKTVVPGGGSTAPGAPGTTMPGPGTAGPPMGVPGGPPPGPMGGPK